MGPLTLGSSYTVHLYSGQYKSMVLFSVTRLNLHRNTVSDKIYIFFYVLFLLGKNVYDGVQNLKLQLVWSARNIS